MMETRGRIVAIADGMAEVRVAAVSACGSCRSQASCGTAASDSDSRVLKVLAMSGMRPGDEVTLHMEAGTIAGGALLGYLMPALTVLAGAVIGSLLYGSDAAAVLGAGIGLAIGLVVLRLGSRLISHDHLQPSLCGPAHDSFKGDRP